MPFPKITGCLCAALLFPSAADAAGITALEVPALSSEMRLPNERPSDAGEEGAVSFIAAKGEFEPASFVLLSDKDRERVSLKASDLKGPNGAVIPADALDLKIVKVWYQGGTAWYSYFSDPNRQELVPELLLNDENLIKVDHEKKGNYLRVGEDYRWVSGVDTETGFFNYLTEPVADAKTLQPFTLQAGEYKQIWATLKVPEDAEAGLYSGTITMLDHDNPAATVRVNVRVLPFSLPDPKTYYDLEKDFLVAIYATDILQLADHIGLPEDTADRIQSSIYQNLLDHNVRNIRSCIVQHRFTREPERGEKLLRRELRLLRESGAVMKPLLSLERFLAMGNADPEEEGAAPRLRAVRKIFQEELGHTDVYLTGMDEAGARNTKKMREDMARLDEFFDLKVWLTTKRHHIDLAGYMIGLANHAGWPTREEAAIWHALGGRVASYAAPHTGPENPDIFRRWEGLARYKANYDGSFNYKYFSQFNINAARRLDRGEAKGNLWNDSSPGKFRGFNMVHPTPNGMIDTIAWEGFREGIDDIRYATLLRQLAFQAKESNSLETRHFGGKALLWLELTDMTTADLNEARQEMIRYILELQTLLK